LINGLFILFESLSFASYSSGLSDSIVLPTLITLGHAFVFIMQIMLAFLDPGIIRKQLRGISYS
jgi:hypothetical protein